MKKNIIIVLLSIFSCLLLYYSYNINKQLKIEKELIESGYYNSGTYTSVNVDANIKELKEKNKELYDSIKEYKDEINFLTQYSYQKEYVFDTIYTEAPTPIQEVQEFEYFNSKNDSINYILKIGSITEPNWYSLNLHVSDEFTIINRNDGDINKTTITSQNSGIIEDVTVFNKKKTNFSDHFSHGVIGGVGYGLINQNIDVFVGYGITIKF